MPWPRPLTRQAARADPDDRRHVLEARALGVLPRVEEAEDAVAPIRLDPDRWESRPEGEAGGKGEEPEGDAGDEEDSRDHRGEGDRRAEVGLDDDHGREKRQTTSPTGFISSAIARARRSPGEHGAYPDAERQLRETGLVWTLT